MSIFQDVELTWKGDSYTVPHDKVMRLIAVIEDHVRINDLVDGKGPQLSKLASAYGAALRFAGARVSDEEVYEDFFATGAQVVAELTAGLLSMMVPPSTLKSEGSKKKTAAKGK